MKAPVIESFGVFLSRGVEFGKIRELGDAIDQSLRVEPVRTALASVRMYPPTTNSATYSASLVAERKDWIARVAKRGFTAAS